MARLGIGVNVNKVYSLKDEKAVEVETMGFNGDCKQSLHEQLSLHLVLVSEV